MNRSGRVIGLIWMCFLLFILVWAVHPVGAAATEAKVMEEGGTDKGMVVMVTIGDNGRQITLETGGILEIELQTMGGAGYSWEFDGLDTDYLDVVSHGTRALADRPGAPVLSMWRLKGKKSGVTKIVMYNYRVWEGKEKSVNRFVLDVRVVE